MSCQDEFMVPEISDRLDTILGNMNRYKERKEVLEEAERCAGKAFDWMEASKPTLNEPGAVCQFNDVTPTFEVTVRIKRLR